MRSFIVDAVDVWNRDGSGWLRSLTSNEAEQSLAVEKRLKLRLPKDVVTISKSDRNTVGDVERGWFKHLHSHRIQGAIPDALIP